MQGGIEWHLSFGYRTVPDDLLHNRGMSVFLMGIRALRAREGHLATLPGRDKESEDVVSLASTEKRRNERHVSSEIPSSQRIQRRSAFMDVVACATAICVGSVCVIFQRAHFRATRTGGNYCAVAHTILRRGGAGALHHR